MNNVLFIERDLEYGLKLLNELSLYDSDLRIFSFVRDKSEITKEILHEANVILIEWSLMEEFSEKLESSKERLLVLNEDKTKIFPRKISQISKYEPAEKIGKAIIKVINKFCDNETYIKGIISKELQYLRYNPKYQGTEYLCEVIYTMYKNNGSGNNLKTKIYPIVAEKYGVNIQNIKCNIINATDIMSWDCEEDRLIEYLGFSNYVKPGPKKVAESVLKNIKDKLK